MVKVGDVGGGGCRCGGGRRRRKRAREKDREGMEVALEEEGEGDCDTGFFVEDLVRLGGRGEDIEFENCGRGGVEEGEEVGVCLCDVVRW